MSDSLNKLRGERGASSKFSENAKRSQPLWSADFRVSDLRWVGGHRPPLQVFAKRSHPVFAPFAPVAGNQSDSGRIRLNPTFEIFQPRMGTNRHKCRRSDGSGALSAVIDHRDSRTHFYIRVLSVHSGLSETKPSYAAPTGLRLVGALPRASLRCALGYHIVVPSGLSVSCRKLRNEPNVFGMAVIDRRYSKTRTKKIQT